jgi:CheY-like chemotaxis protein
MEKAARPFCILIAEDNEDDYLLARDALEECWPDVELRWVKDGEELMDYLLHQGVYKDPVKCPLPNLLLLDLNMPRKNGREALKEIRATPRLRCLPVVVLTSSLADNDVLFSYEQGANSFLRKPVGFEPFVDVMRALCDYWFGHAALPPAESNSG